MGVRISPAMVIAWLTIILVISSYTTLSKENTVGQPSSDDYMPDKVYSNADRGPNNLPLAGSGLVSYLPAYLRRYLSHQERLRGLTLPTDKRDPRMGGRIGVRYHRCYHNPVACF